MIADEVLEGELERLLDQLNAAVAPVRMQLDRFDKLSMARMKDLLNSGVWFTLPVSDANMKLQYWLAEIILEENLARPPDLGMAELMWSLDHGTEIPRA